MPQNRIRIVDVADTLGLRSMASKESNPSLTTIHQEANLRAKTAIECLEAMRDGTEYKPQIVLPVDLRQYRIILSADTASEVWQRRCRAAAAGAVLKPSGRNCAVLP